jgi:3-deoxy-D-manno-octulosonic-acid transferase
MPASSAALKWMPRWPMRQNLPHEPAPHEHPPPMSTRRPLSLRAYRLASILASPLVKAYLGRRLKRGKEDPARLSERFGMASQPRPAGRLIWIHAASVGETLSILPLITRICAAGPQVLLTTGTLTSAQLVAQRLPSGARHQFVPIDIASAVTRFLDHWQPDLAVFCESELWPNLIGESHRRAIPVGIVNGRMSARSFKTWRRLPRFAHALLGPLAFCLAQSLEDTAHYAKLGAKAHSIGNLKYDNAALPFDSGEAETFRKTIAHRPVLLAASTHPGEEAILLRVYAKLREDFPDLLLILVPRHPERGAELAVLIAESGQVLAQRSRSMALTRKTQIYLADTMGELGLFYGIADLAIIGGSLEPIGGHNPIEAARAGIPILTGPHFHHFSAVFEGFLAAGAAMQATDEADLLNIARTLLKDAAARAALATAASAFIKTQEGALERSFAHLAPYLFEAKS